MMGLGWTAVMLRKGHSNVIPDADEVYRILRARLALTLHKTPADIDAMPQSDVDDLLELLWADDQR